MGESSRQQNVRHITIPRGLKCLLEEMSREILRWNPPDVPFYLAEYLEDRVSSRRTGERIECDYIDNYGDIPKGGFLRQLQECKDGQQIPYNKSDKEIARSQHDFQTAQDCGPGQVASVHGEGGAHMNYGNPEGTFAYYGQPQCDPSYAQNQPSQQIISSQSQIQASPSSAHAPAPRPLPACEEPLQSSPSVNHTLHSGYSTSLECQDQAQRLQLVKSCVGALNKAIDIVDTLVDIENVGRPPSSAPAALNNATRFNCDPPMETRGQTGDNRPAGATAPVQNCVPTANSNLPQIPTVRGQRCQAFLDTMRRAVEDMVKKIIIAMDSDDCIENGQGSPQSLRRELLTCFDAAHTQAVPASNATLPTPSPSIHINPINLAPPTGATPSTTSSFPNFPPGSAIAMAGSSIQQIYEECMKTCGNNTCDCEAPSNPRFVTGDVSSSPSIQPFEQNPAAKAPVPIAQPSANVVRQDCQPQPPSAAPRLSPSGNNIICPDCIQIPITRTKSGNLRTRDGRLINVGANGEIWEFTGPGPEQQRSTMGMATAMAAPSQLQVQPSSGQLQSSPSVMPRHVLHSGCSNMNSAAQAYPSAPAPAYEAPIQSSPSVNNFGTQGQTQSQTQGSKVREDCVQQPPATAPRLSPSGRNIICPNCTQIPLTRTRSGNFLIPDGRRLTVAQDGSIWQLPEPEQSRSTMEMGRVPSQAAAPSAPAPGLASVPSMHSTPSAYDHSLHSGYSSAAIPPQMQNCGPAPVSSAPAPSSESQYQLQSSPSATNHSLHSGYSTMQTQGPSPSSTAIPGSNVREECVPQPPSAAPRLSPSGNNIICPNCTQIPVTRTKSGNFRTPDGRLISVGPDGKLWEEPEPRSKSEPGQESSVELFPEQSASKTGLDDANAQGKAAENDAQAESAKNDANAKAAEDAQAKAQAAEDAAKAKAAQNVIAAHSVPMISAMPSSASVPSASAASARTEGARGDANQLLAGNPMEIFEGLGEWFQGARDFVTNHIHIIRQLLSGELSLADAPGSVILLAISFIVGIAVGYSLGRYFGLWGGSSGGCGCGAATPVAGRAPTCSTLISSVLPIDFLQECGLMEMFTNLGVFTE